MHATILQCSLFIVHWPDFIVHSFHNIVQPNVQHVVHNANCAIVHHFEQFSPTLHTAAWPVSSCRARPKTWPRKVSGIGLLGYAAGALHIFALILHVLQKTFQSFMKLSGHLWVPIFILRHPKQMFGSAVRRSLMLAQEIQGQEPIP